VSANQQGGEENIFKRKSGGNPYPKKKERKKKPSLGRRKDSREVSKGKNEAGGGFSIVWGEWKFGKSVVHRGAEKKTPRWEMEGTTRGGTSRFHRVGWGRGEGSIKKNGGEEFLVIFEVDGWPSRDSGG